VSDTTYRVENLLCLAFPSHKCEGARVRPNIQVLFGKRLRRIRLKRGLSQEKLAELAGLHTNYVGRIERGEQNVSLINIGKLARGLKIPPANLFKGIR
jgi:ribosome-binding protein aMBF1 (putative translation factor)